MLNKGLLLASGGKGWAPYTHIIVLCGFQQVSDDFYAAGFSPSFENSSITPNTLSMPYGDKTPIAYLYNTFQSGEANISLGTGGYFLANYGIIYLGRSDTRENFGNPSVGSEEEGYATWRGSTPLFRPEDAGKEIPVWLSHTPPPY